MTLKSKRNYGVVRYGRQVTLRVVVAVRLYPLFVSTLNNKERLNDDFRELSRLHPRPCMIKINKILLKDQVSFNRLLGGRPALRTGY